MNRPLSGAILTDLFSDKTISEPPGSSFCLSCRCHHRDVCFDVALSCFAADLLGLILSLVCHHGRCGCSYMCHVLPPLEAAPYLVSNAPYSIRLFPSAALISMPLFSFVLIINFPIGIFSFTFRSFTVAAPSSHRREGFRINILAVRLRGRQGY